MLWVAGYVMVVLAPLALMAVAVKPGAQGVAVVFAAGLGFVGLSLLVLQALTSGRWGSITASFGLRSVLLLHRAAGKAALILVIGHVVALIVDDPARVALLDLGDAPLRARAGVVALLALLVLAGTSVWRRGLRLSYERWRVVHIACAAVVIAASFVHVVGVSAYFSLPAIRWAVLILVLVGAGAIVYVRVTQPYSMTLRPFRVRRVTRERGDAVTVDLEPDGHRGVRFGPGQFAWLKPAQRPYGMDEHPFSLSSSAARRDRLSFTVKPIGDFTDAVADLRVGTSLLVDGPHGEAVSDDRSVRGRLLLAAGIGITPAISVLRTAAERRERRPIVLFYGSRRWEEVTFREELRALQRSLPNLRVVHVLSTPHTDWQGERGRIDEQLLRRHVPHDLGGWAALVCGPAGMVADATAALGRVGLPRSAIQAEGLA
jgi:predicted ferric reductase